jgi:menaquinone-dependent protoporphyrinogen oxidase
MQPTLIVYSTTDGHTQAICERVADALARRGRTVVLRHLPECSDADVAACGAVVIGASIRYGKHKPEVAAFVGRHRAALDARPNALFSVNVVARKPQKNRAATNPYFQKLVRELNWQPRLPDVFAGRIDYPKLGPVDRTMIRFIMWLTKGPTDPKGTFEFTDWARVDAFAAAFDALLEPAPPRTA